MQVLNIIVSINCYNYCVETDERINKVIKRSLTDTAKETRKALKTRKKVDKINEKTLQDSFMAQALQTKGKIPIYNFMHKKLLLRRAIPPRQIPRRHAQFTRNYWYSIIEMLDINTVFISQSIR